MLAYQCPEAPGRSKHKFFLEEYTLHLVPDSHGQSQAEHELLTQNYKAHHEARNNRNRIRSSKTETLQLCDIKYVFFLHFRCIKKQKRILKTLAKNELLAENRESTIFL